MKIRLMDCQGQVLETLACLKTTTSMWLNCLAESSIQKSISLSLFHRRGTAEIELSVFEGLQNIKVWVVERWRILPPWCYSAKPRLILISDFPAEYHTLPTLNAIPCHSLNTVPYHTVPPLNIVPHHTLNTTWPISHRALLHTNCLLCILAFSLYIWPIL